MSRIYTRVTYKYAFSIYNFIYIKYNNILDYDDISEHCMWINQNSNSYKSNKKYNKFIKNQLQNITNTKINCAINNGHIKTIKALAKVQSINYANLRSIKHKKINFDNVLSTSIKCVHYNVIKMLLENKICSLAITDVKNTVLDIIRSSSGYSTNINKFDVIKLLSEYGLDIISIKDKLYDYAIRSNNVNMVKFLMSKLAISMVNLVNLVNFIVCREYSDEILFALLEHTSITDITHVMFIKAIIYRNHSIVKLLIDKGADIHAVDSEALAIAVKHDKYEIVKLLIECGIHTIKNNYIFLLAVKRGVYEIVKLLLECGINFHINEEESFLLAIKSNHVKITELFLQRKVDIHFKNDEAFATAVWYNNYEITKLLLEYGVKVNTRNNEVFREAIVYKKDDIDKLYKERKQIIMTDYFAKQEYEQIIAKYNKMVCLMMLYIE